MSAIVEGGRGVVPDKGMNENDKSRFTVFLQTYRKSESNTNSEWHTSFNKSGTCVKGK